MATVKQKVTAEEKRWQAENDARTLMEAKMIQSIPGRLTAAAKAAKTMAVTAEKEATAMKNVAKKSKLAKPAKPAKKEKKK